MGIRKPPSYVRRYTSISAVIDMLQRGEMPLLDPQTWDDRNDRYFMEKYRTRRGARSLYALCAAQCAETYHHWRVFTGQADGAFVELRRAPMEAAIRSIPGLRFGPVTYLKLEEVEELGPSDVENLPFLKRWGFSAEDEYRIIYESSDPQEPAYGLELLVSWINKIWINPWIPPTLFESLEKTLRSIDGCEDIGIARSRLINSVRWQAAGDAIVQDRSKGGRRRVLKIPNALEGS